MSHFRGILTVIYRVPDVNAAKSWYAKAFGVEPYFDQPFYVGFEISGYELGLQPQTRDARPGRGGGLAYWGVDDADAAVTRLVALGAAPGAAIQDVGEGILVGSVHDPFGNPIGIIQNPHFKLPSR
jgi:predicted enzyme related to lactoylglutathione lyase